MDSSSDSEGILSLRLLNSTPNSSSASDTSSSQNNLGTSQKNIRSDNVLEEDFIAVFGGLGYIGSHTCLELLKAGYNVLIIDNLSNSFEATFSQILNLVEQHHHSKRQKVPLMHLYRADYRDESRIREILSEYVIPDLVSTFVTAPRSRITGVIHFAAYKSVLESIEQPLKYYDNNVAGLIKFCSILSEFNIKRFIFSSSATVYGSKANSRVQLREEDCVHQSESYVDQFGTYHLSEPGCIGLTNPYGRTKWMCEAILSDIAVADREWSIMALRYFNPIGCDESGLIGEDPCGVPTNLMPVLMQVISGKIPSIKIFGTDYPNTHDGTAVRDYIHVSDLARGHICSLQAAAKMNGFKTYNLGSGTGYSVQDMIKAVEQVSSVKIPIQISPRREGDVEKCIAWPKRAEEELHWKTERSLIDACEDMMRFIRRKNFQTNVMMAKVS
ncbi:UDP-glucose 4-epimerase [Golovinomyces cichoracearum]|uniref:UDP-glucose 4-epimerase n=1 Tax=Golovinomyces cichoracearum TaxID=62708 RepID=A0A420IIF0_9PEZI|nr:UDP-glucose 4-epimerase [Golovinomyces cichoracearum]